MHIETNNKLYKIRGISMTFQEALAEAFARRMNFKSGDLEFALVEVATELVGNVDEPEAFAEKIINKFLEFYPPEIVNQGVEAINVFLSNFSYDSLKQKFLLALLDCNKEK